MKLWTWLCNRPAWWLLVLLIAFLALVALTGCDVRAGTHAVATPATPVVEAAALPEDVKSIEAELKAVRGRERLLVGALDDARTEAAQTSLRIGAGACLLAALVLFGLGVWTSRPLLVHLSIGAAALGGLLIFAAVLAPYAMWIGIGIALIVIGIAVWMLVNRQRGLEQVSRAVDAIKPALPEYAAIFRQHLDTGVEHLIDHVRDTRKDT